MEKMQHRSWEVHFLSTTTIHIFATVPKSKEWHMTTWHEKITLMIVTEVVIIIPCQWLNPNAELYFVFTVRTRQFQIQVLPVYDKQSKCEREPYTVWHEHIQTENPGWYESKIQTRNFKMKYYHVCNFAESSNENRESIFDKQEGKIRLATTDGWTCFINH